MFLAPLVLLSSFAQSPTSIEDLREALSNWDYPRVKEVFEGLGQNRSQLTPRDYTGVAHVYRSSLHPTDAFAVIQQGFKVFPNVDTAIEYVACAQESGQITVAQNMLSRVLSEQLNDEQRRAASSELWSLAKLTWQFDFSLTEKPLNYPAGYIRNRGYYEFYRRPDSDFQRTTLSTTGNVDHVVEVTDAAQNRITRIYPRSWEKPVTLRLILRKNPFAYSLTTSEVKPEAIPEDVRACLGKTSLIDPSGPIAQDLAKRLKGKDRAETIERIRDYVLKTVQYKEPVLPGEENKRDSETTLQRKRGYCWEIARAMTAVLRAAGIPARRTYALNIYPEVNTDLDFSTAVPAWCHVLAEFWDPKYGWIPMQSRPSNVFAMRYLPLASELVDEPFADGTMERINNECWYGNTERPSKVAACSNVTVKLVASSLR